QANNGIFVARSDDGGVTWGQPATVAANLYDGQHPVPFEIIPDLAIDTYHTLPDGRPNPNYGNLYETWARYYPSGQFPGEPDATGGSQVMVAISDDDGQSWQVQVQLKPGSGIPVSVVLSSDNSGQGLDPGLGLENRAHLAIGPEGNVYLSLFVAGDFEVFTSTAGARSFVAPDRATGRGLPFAPANIGDASPSTPGAGLPNNHFRTQP